MPTRLAFPEPVAEGFQIEFLTTLVSLILQPLHCVIVLSFLQHLHCFLDERLRLTASLFESREWRLNVDKARVEELSIDG